MKRNLTWIIAATVFGLYPGSVRPADTIKLAFIAPAACP